MKNSRGDAKLVQYGGQVVVNELAQQSWWRVEAVVAGAAAGRHPAGGKVATNLRRT
jgi:hypothetical protein